MELRQLRYFVRTVELGSMSQAALDLDVAQSAISLQIQRLEGELSARLLLRTPSGVAPTDAGIAFLSHAQLALFSGLYGDGHCVMAVGDPQQSIYGFRNADVLARPLQLRPAEAAGLMAALGLVVEAGGARGGRLHHGPGQPVHRRGCGRRRAGAGLHAPAAMQIDAAAGMGGCAGRP